MARLGIRTSLTPWDITAIRFAVSGSLLLPYAIHKGLALERLGWTGLAAVVAGCGAPMVLLANAGLLFAPAAHAGALFPGVTPLMVALLAATILREAFTSQKRIGCTLIVIGVIGIVWGAGGNIGTTQNIGHLLFLSAGLAWACYTVAMRRARLDGLHAAGHKVDKTVRRQIVAARSDLKSLDRVQCGCLRPSIGGGAAVTS